MAKKNEKEKTLKLTFGGDLVDLILRGKLIFSFTQLMAAQMVCTRKGARSGLSVLHGDTLKDRVGRGPILSIYGVLVLKMHTL